MSEFTRIFWCSEDKMAASASTRFPPLLSASSSSSTPSQLSPSSSFQSLTQAAAAAAAEASPSDRDCAVRRPVPLALTTKQRSAGSLLSPASGGLKQLLAQQQQAGTSPSGAGGGSGSASPPSLPTRARSCLLCLLSPFPPFSIPCSSS